MIIEIAFYGIQLGPEPTRAMMALSKKKLGETVGPE
jgi:hypothetical protein